MRNRSLAADDPREWLRRARSNLSQATGGIDLPDVILEDLCFQAQQSAEKALKGVLIKLAVRFRRTHDLAALVSLIANAGQTVPQRVRESARLSDYAVAARYPGLAEPVTLEEYDQAVSLASDVVGWAQNVIAPGPAAPTQSRSGPGQGREQGDE